MVGVLVLDEMAGRLSGDVGAFQERGQVTWRSFLIVKDIDGNR